MNIEGKTIKRMRRMTQAELDNEYWEGPCDCIEFEDGSILYPSCDEEGNGPGMFFASKKEKVFTLKATT